MASLLFKCTLFFLVQLCLENDAIFWEFGIKMPNRKETSELELFGPSFSCFGLLLPPELPLNGKLGQLPRLLVQRRRHWFALAAHDSAPWTSTNNPLLPLGESLR